MRTLKIPFVMAEAEFRELNGRYLRAADITIEVSAKGTPEDISSLARFLLQRSSEELARVILADLVELEQFPVELLGDVFDVEDTACKVSVCLREDLPPELEKKCAESGDPNVVEHFLHRRNSRKD